MANNLFGSDDEGGSYVFGVNKEYEKKYNKFKEKQELAQLKDKHGDVGSKDYEDDESTSESEDDNAEALTADIERDFLKTLSMLQSKDPRIYNKDETFFNDESTEQKASVKKSIKVKPMHLKDYERQQLLTRGSEAFVSDEESEEDIGLENHIQAKGMSYVEEQKALKESFKKVLEDSENDDGDDSGFLQKRVKSANDLQKEEDDYINWLKGDGKHLTEEEKKDLDGLKSYWSDPKLDDSERFLRDYILNKGYKEHDDDAIPTYNEIVGGWNDEENDKEEQESDIEKEEEFERKYNFRYEEPDSEFIKSYPRTIASSVRVKDDSRKQKRKEREQRKEKEKEKKKEEIKQLKKLKRKEIMEKLDKLKEITGNDKIGFLEDDLDGNFDAAKYDSLMKDVFNNDYYNVDDTQKPEFSDDEELAPENWDEWQGGDEEGGQDYYEDYEGEDFNMDCDYVADTKPKKKEDLKTLRRGRRKKNSKFADAIENKKPTYNPDEKTFEEYFDEYYKLDYEDIIGDMPVRFNYRQVMPNDFGLSTEEVLLCPDKELNQWCSVKKAMKYYTNDEERRYRTKFKRKAKDTQKKLDLLPSLKQEIDDERTSNDEDTKDTVDHGMNGDRLQSKRPSSESVTSAGWKRKRLPPQSKFKSKFNKDKEFDQQRREKLEKMFRGAKKHKLSRLSSNRLAAYGLSTTALKKRKKK